MSTAAMASAPADPEMWARLAAEVPLDAVQWRQQGKPKPRDGAFYAPFVAYIDAQLVRDRLDSVCPGAWSLALELLPAAVDHGSGEEVEPFAFKARLTVHGVSREDVGVGKDYKQASTDAFKRAAVRFGIGHELYTDYELVWVKVDSDSKFARALEDPAVLWAKRQGKAPAPVAAEGEQRRPPSSPASPSATPTAASAPAKPEARSDAASCPKCGGAMWDNRANKKNPKAPDFKCRRTGCDGLIWPPREKKQAVAAGSSDEPPFPDDSELPF